MLDGPTCCSKQSTMFDECWVDKSEKGRQDTKNIEKQKKREYRRRVLPLESCLSVYFVPTTWYVNYFLQQI